MATLSQSLDQSFIQCRGVCPPCNQQAQTLNMALTPPCKKLKIPSWNRMVEGKLGIGNQGLGEKISLDFWLEPCKSLKN